MKIIFLFLAAILLTSCAQQRYCQPSKRSKDYAVRQWLKQRSDGYYVVTTIHGFRSRSAYVFECKPDSAQLASLRKS